MLLDGLDAYVQAARDLRVRKFVNAMQQKDFFALRWHCIDNSHHAPQSLSADYLPFRIGDRVHSVIPRFAGRERKATSPPPRPIDGEAADNVAKQVVKLGYLLRPGPLNDLHKGVLIKIFDILAIYASTYVSQFRLSLPEGRVDRLQLSSLIFHYTASIRRLRRSTGSAARAAPSSEPAQADYGIML